MVCYLTPASFTWFTVEWGEAGVWAHTAICWKKEGTGRRASSFTGQTCQNAPTWLPKMSPATSRTNPTKIQSFIKGGPKKPKWNGWSEKTTGEKVEWSLQRFESGGETGCSLDWLDWFLWYFTRRTSSWIPWMTEAEQRLSVGTEPLFTVRDAQTFLYKKDTFKTIKTTFKLRSDQSRCHRGQRSAQVPSARVSNVPP